MSAKYLQIITLLFFVTSLVLQLNAADASKLKKEDPQLESLLETRIGTAENLNDDHIQIDGKLDEEAWQRGVALTGFIQNNPDEDWRLYFLLGFNYFYILEDHASAAKYLERASRMPGHPKYLPRLAARMYAKAQKTDLALELFQEMYRQHDDENVKAAIAERITVLVAKKQARSPALAAAVEKYKEAYGQYPITRHASRVGRRPHHGFSTLSAEALIHAGLIRELPAYLDGQYVIDPDTGRVDWVSESVSQWP